MLGGGVPLRPKNPYPISDQMVKFGTPSEIGKRSLFTLIDRIGRQTAITLIESSETSTGTVPDEKCTGKEMTKTLNSKIEQEKYSPSQT